MKNIADSAALDNYQTKSDQQNQPTHLNSIPTSSELSIAPAGTPITTSAVAPSITIDPSNSKQKSQHFPEFDVDAALEQLKALGYQVGDKVFIRCLPGKGLSLEEQLKLGLAFRPKGTSKIIPVITKGYLTLKPHGATFTRVFSSGKTNTFIDGFGYLTEVNQGGRGIYLVANPGGDADAKITQAPTTFSEFDEGSFEEQLVKIAQLEELYGAKALIISSGGKSLHTYFKFTEPLSDLSQWKNLQERANDHIGADPAIKNPARLMRLAGAAHIKFDAAGQMVVRLSQIMQLPEGTVDASRIDAVLPALPVKQRKQITANGLPKNAVHLPQGGAVDGLVVAAASAIQVIPPYEAGCGTYPDYLRAAAGSLFDLGDAGYDLWSQADLMADDPRGTEGWLDSLGTPTGEATLGSLFTLAKQHGWQPETANKAAIAKLIRNSELADAKVAKAAQPGLYSIAGDARAERYLSPLGDVVPGSIVAISSPVGTGKTQMLVEYCKRYLNENLDAQIELISYRNFLAAQTASRLDISFIHDGPEDFKLKQTYIDTEAGLAYAIDSLGRRAASIFTAISEGLKGVIILDEMDALFKHIANGGTLGAKLSQTWENFCAVIAKALEHGWVVIGLEHNLTQHAIDTIQRIAPDAPVEKILNEGIRQNRKVTFWKNTCFETGEYKDVTSKDWATRSIKMAKKGEVILAPCTSKNQVERVALGAEKEGLDCIAVTSDTVNDYADLLKDPQILIALAKAKLEGRGLIVAFTSSMESGVDLGSGLFDRVVAYASHMEDRAIFQMMNRDRSLVPLEIFCTEQAINWRNKKGSKAFYPDKVVEDWDRFAVLAKQGLEADKLPDLVRKMGEQGQASPAGKNFTKMAADYQARQNISDCRLRDGLKELCEQMWGPVEERPFDFYQKDPDGRFLNPAAGEWNSFWGEVKEELAERETSKKIEADHKIFSQPKDARRVLEATTSTQDERRAAEKALIISRWPSIGSIYESAADGDKKAREMIKRHCVENKHRIIKRYEDCALAKIPELIKASDRVRLEEQMCDAFMINRDIPVDSLKVGLYHQSGLARLVELHKDVEFRYSNDCPEAIGVATRLKANNELIKYLFGIDVSGDSTVGAISKVSRRFGHCPKAVARPGKRGEQKEVWRIDAGLSKEELSLRASIIADTVRRIEARIREYEGLQEPVSPELLEDSIYSNADDTPGALGKSGPIIPSDFDIEPENQNPAYGGNRKLLIT